MTDQFDRIPLQSTLQKDGVRAGLKYLNGRVEHRYTGIYQIDSGTLRCVELYDRQGEMDASFLAVVPFEDSYCQFTLRDGAFKTSNTLQDMRLNGHKYQGIIVSYHGVPIVRASRSDSRALFGTLCHFDTMEQQLPDDEFHNLQVAAEVIAPFVCKA